MLLTLQQVKATIIQPVFIDLLPSRFDSPESEVLLLATGLQESGFATRMQIHGPARSFWQLEKGGGVFNVLASESTRKYAIGVCAHLKLLPNVDAVYNALPSNDMLGYAFARLDYYSNPHPLPALGDEKGAWDYYLATWRPGKPHSPAWPSYYHQALEAVLSWKK
jgi:hypothetical protein